MTKRTPTKIGEEFLQGNTAVMESPADTTKDINIVPPVVKAEEITPADLFEENVAYTFPEIETKLGLSRGAVADAVRAGDFAYVGGDDSLSGRQVIARWGKHVVPEEVQRRYRRVMAARAARNAPPVPKPRTLADDADAIVNADNAATAASEADWQGHAWGTYLAVLGRYNAPEPGDATTLAQVMVDLNITRDQVKADVEVIERAGELAARHAEREQRTRAVTEARRQRDELLARHKTELAEAERALRQVSRRSQDASSAARDLNELSRRRPMLFDLSTDPPTLRTVEGNA